MITRNQTIGDWETGSVTLFNSMFSRAAAFDQAIGDWDTGAGTTMRSMFYDAAAFNQDLGDWCVSNFASAPTGFDDRASAWSRPRPVWGSCP